MSPFRPMFVMTTWVGLSLLALGQGPQTPPGAPRTPPLSNTVILIVRHAEKPQDEGGTGNGLTPAGEARAKAYANYFTHYKLGMKTFRIDHLFVTADSKKSARPRLTMQPLANKYHIPIDNRFKNDEYADLAKALQTKRYGNGILICWHHGHIPSLLQALNVDPKTLIPNGKWPDNVYDWVIQLSFDKNGKLNPTWTKRVNEHLMSGDSK